MIAFFNAVFYQPLYNALVFLIDILPTEDVGIAVIMLTIIVKIILLPLSLKAARTQAKMKIIEPQIKEIQAKYKDNKEEQGRRMLEIYREAKVNPFSSIFILLAQFPVVIALYMVFVRGGLPVIDTDLLYSFVSVPLDVSMSFLGSIDLTEKNLFIALIAGLTQFIQAHIITSLNKKKEEEKKAEKTETTPSKPSFGDDFAKSMNFNMKFVFPIIIGFIAYNFSGAVGLYLVISNLFGIGQEMFVRKKIRQEEAYEQR